MNWIKTCEINLSLEESWYAHNNILINYNAIKSKHKDKETFIGTSTANKNHSINMNNNK